MTMLGQVLSVRVNFARSTRCVENNLINYNLFQIPFGPLLVVQIEPLWTKFLKVDLVRQDFQISHYILICGMVMGTYFATKLGQFGVWTTNIPIRQRTMYQLVELKTKFIEDQRIMLHWCVRFMAPHRVTNKIFCDTIAQLKEEYDEQSSKVKQYEHNHFPKQPKGNQQAKPNNLFPFSQICYFSIVNLDANIRRQQQYLLARHLTIQTKNEIID